jgi:predicted carbohydrate-binding protein with CBM5 and CBM33 domain
MGWGTKLLAVTVGFLQLTSSALGHGWMADPASRNLASNNPDKMSLNAGGIGSTLGSRAWAGGRGSRYGACGDPDGRRDHEIGGRWSNGGKIQKTYRAGDTITVKLFLSTPHKGVHGFRVCPTRDGGVSKGCFEAHKLKTNGADFIWSEDKQDLNFQVKLPPDVSGRAVLQWYWIVANSCDLKGFPGGNMGSCDTSSNVEEFWNCADINIEGGQSKPEKPVVTGPTAEEIRAAQLRAEQIKAEQANAAAAKKAAEIKAAQAAAAKKAAEIKADAAANAAAKREAARDAAAARVRAQQARARADAAQKRADKADAAQKSIADRDAAQERADADRKQSEADAYASRLKALEDADRAVKPLFVLAPVATRTVSRTVPVPTVPRPAAQKKPVQPVQKPAQPPVQKPPTAVPTLPSIWPSLAGAAVTAAAAFGAGLGFVGPWTSAAIALAIGGVMASILLFLRSRKKETWWEQLPTPPTHRVGEKPRAAPAKRMALAGIAAEVASEYLLPASVQPAMRGVRRAIAMRAE